MRYLLTFILMVFLSACGAESSSFHSTSKSAGDFPPTPKMFESWEKLPIPIYVDNSFPTEFYDAINQAIGIWEADGSNYFEFRGITATGTCNKDSRNVICWDLNPNADGYLGMTSTQFPNGPIIEFDTIIFGSPKEYSILKCADGSVCSVATGKYDLVTTLAHELGHGLGFSDTTQKDCVMNPNFSLGDVVQSLDDILAASLNEGYEDVLNPEPMADL
ncbi:hypothetical protein K1X76_06055 [bacterium]|nr:hypothetical protein [bacterium]